MSPFLPPPEHSGKGKAGKAVGAAACPQGCNLWGLEGKALPSHSTFPKNDSGSLSFWLNQRQLCHHAKRRANALCSRRYLGQVCVSAVLLHPVTWKIVAWDVYKGRHGLAKPRIACESIREEPTEVSLPQQRRALSSWMSELLKRLTNLEHYWNKNSICRNFNQCKIIQAPNPSPPQHAISSTLSQKNRRAQCSRDRLLRNQPYHGALLLLPEPANADSSPAQKPCSSLGCLNAAARSRGNCSFPI